MQLMDNLKVAYKLLILAVIAALGLAVISFFGLGALQKSQDDMTHLYDVNVMGLVHLGDARQGMRSAQTMTVIMTTVQNDPARMQDLKQKFDNAVKETNESLEAFNKANSGVAETAEQYAKTVKDWNELKQGLTNSVNLSQSGQQAAGLEAYNAGAKSATTVASDLVKLADDAAKAADAIDKQNDEESAAARRNMIVLSVLTLVILVGAAMWITKAITSPLNKMMGICRKLRDGDFRTDNNGVARGDEFGDMERAIDDVCVTLNKLMRQISRSSEQLAASSEELTASAGQSAQASDQVAQNVTTSASAVIEQQQLLQDMRASVDKSNEAVENLGNVAGAVTNEAKSANDQAADGTKAIEFAVQQILSAEAIVKESADTVNKLGQSSQEIGQIVETISGIAGQTNLLALNAAIEAARAGEQGRGFAVVAEEVRKLAEESQNAAQQITSLIKGIQDNTSDAVASMEKGSKAVREGSASVEKLRETFQAINAASNGVVERAQNMIEELHAVSEDTQNINEKSVRIAGKGDEVSQEMESVSAASEEQSASATEIADASQSLANLAQELQTSLQKFRF
ncbi:methyl-accepting chemotaxis protein [Anaerovibrio lipolyticus]|uniref:methyl-accepting chemotaxis protein n=1 Tax=Anaerovibrio lipolyticus TaxID=82374 RepID=UPI00047F7259|nr:HAMP domain-containing methyl-accepting chemotaxis protein [Anaerovibrio lipolyticus]